MLEVRKQFWINVAVLAGALSIASIAPTRHVGGQTGTVPQYEGPLLRMPVGFDTWVFVGSNLGLSYKPNLPMMTPLEATRSDQQLFHNIYINPEAYRHFAATGEFPEPTILVMEIYTAASKEPKGVLATGVFNNERVGLEVAVKNSHRPDGGTSWAYYTFINPQLPQVVRDLASAHPDSECADCHKAHASIDNVWVQFYPNLRKLMK